MILDYWHGTSDCERFVENFSDDHQTLDVNSKWRTTERMQRASTMVPCSRFLQSFDFDRASICFFFSSNRLTGAYESLSACAGLCMLGARGMVNCERHGNGRIDAKAGNILTSSTNLSAKASIELCTAIILPSLNGAFCSLFISIMLFPSFTFNCSCRYSKTASWNPSFLKIRLISPAFSISSALTCRPNIRMSFARCTPRLCARMVADPFSGISPRAEKGICR